MPHLQLHKSDIETAQRTWQNIEYDLVKDTSVIKYKNSKWHSKLAAQKLFKFRDWTEFLSDAGFSLKQINIPHYLSMECKSQNPYHKSRSSKSVRIYEKEKENATENVMGVKRKKLDEAIMDAEAKKKQICSSQQRQQQPFINNKFKKIGQRKKILQPHDPMETRSGLMDVVERFYIIMKPIIEEKKKKIPKVMLPGQYKHYPNKDGPVFFYPPKNYRPTPISRPKDLILSGDQWNSIDWDVREGVVLFCLSLTNNLEAWANLPEGSYIP
ncbi:MAG: hypothetical protein EZS28_019789 [Streblomastix strix]|uniref:Uncharacterized protein n=1 Tax=Streblomastix strix TaxID=222440 RepID=A0A5J4VQW7_9EUKA|nr:MAG: hypothetical protein EZS28_019789 [Streblomastix strix]